MKENAPNCYHLINVFRQSQANRGENERREIKTHYFGPPKAHLYSADIFPRPAG